jgi:hypothetical protein
MGDENALPGQDQLDVAQAQAEDVIQPDSVADDLGREAVSGIGHRLPCLQNFPGRINNFDATSIRVRRL